MFAKLKMDKIELKDSREFIKTLNEAYDATSKGNIHLGGVVKCRKCQGTGLVARFGGTPFPCECSRELIG